MNAPEHPPLAQRFLTHAVTNQPPLLGDYDAYATDLPLREALAREGGGWAAREVAAYGVLAGGELMGLGVLANENKPKFRPFDRYGNRIDEVEYHPAYHGLMRTALAHGVPGFAWHHADRPGAHVAHAALHYLHTQAEQGTMCPLAMAYACVPVLRRQPELAGWLARALSTEYDPRPLPGWDKRANLIGMAMTEKQGGSDVRANATRAHAAGTGPDGALFELVGHKYFVSAPMCDAFLMLAYAGDGLTCFLVPRFAPGGALNGLHIQRLKDKLGDWSNASSEMELAGALAWQVGAAGRGIATILEMVALTRLDVMLGSAAIMRQALVQALHHARHRKAFGKLLVDQPLMRNVLADLALESESATALAFRVSRAVDAGNRDPAEGAFARIATAIGKYWLCKRCPPFVNEAQECLGGLGYVEESSLARLYRQAPLNSIWEGSGNVQCLDVLRALSREPATREALFFELAAARGEHPALDAEAARLQREPDTPADLETRSRWLVERMALALQASILLRAGNRAVADAFCESRLGGAHGLAFGTLPPQAPMDALLARAFPA
ncbi:MAG: acyl-CoA dehydrogenase family protein [Nevskia sp.]|nr:acyl-CoA dehydrogenase family protein [Nevskia sp.]